MTRKDYELIASCVKLTTMETVGHILYAKWTMAYFAETIAARLQEDNPRFDRQRFLKACGVE